MAGLIGFALGNALQGAAGYAQAKAQKQQQHDDLLLQTYQEHPEVAGTEEAQKFLKKKYGPEVADSFAQVGKISQQFGMDLSGKGSSAPAGGSAPQPAGGGTIAAGAPQSADPMRAEIDRTDAEISRLQGLQPKYAKSPDYLKIINSHIENLQKHRQQIAEDWRTQQTAARETPEAKAKVAGAEESAREKVKTSPEAIAAETKVAAAKSAAEATAKLRVEFSPAAMKGAIDKKYKETVAELKAKGEAPPTPAEQEKTKNEIATRATNILKSYTAANPPPTLFGKEAWRAGYVDHLLKTDPEVAIATGAVKSLGKTAQPDGDYDLKGRHVMVRKGMAYDAGDVPATPAAEPGSAPTPSVAAK